MRVGETDLLLIVGGCNDYTMHNREILGITEITQILSHTVVSYFGQFRETQLNLFLFFVA